MPAKPTGIKLRVSIERSSDVSPFQKMAWKRVWDILSKENEEEEKEALGTGRDEEQPHCLVNDS